VSWKTSRRVLKPAGLAATFIDGPFEDQAIFNGRFADATRFVIRLTGPIPAPSSYGAWFENDPVTDDYEVLKW